LSTTRNSIKSELQRLQACVNGREIAACYKGLPAQNVAYALTNDQLFGERLRVFHKQFGQFIWMLQKHIAKHPFRSKAPQRARHRARVLCSQNARPCVDRGRDTNGAEIHADSRPLFRLAECKRMEISG
jgi:hypothetical protein